MITKHLTNLCVALALTALTMAGAARAESIRDLVTLQGAAPFTVDGVGIVTGLANTGDKRGAAQVLLRKYLENNNFNMEAGDLAVGNIALVRVTAVIPPFSRAGSVLPVSVTSIGDAKSLEGGELLACDLVAGFNEKPIARASGQVVVGNTGLTRGTVSAGYGSGALQFDNYPFGNVVNREGWVRLNLNQSSWANANAIARQINQTPYLNPNLQETTMFADPGPVQPVAYAKDAGQVIVAIPEMYAHDVTKYIADMLDVPITLERPSKIVINRAKNSIVVTGDVRINRAMASIQDKTVTMQPGTPEQAPFYTLGDDTPRTVVEMEGPGSYADMQGLIDTMNAMGLTTAQVITMIEQLRDAGAITAEFINQ